MANCGFSNGRSNFWAYGIIIMVWSYKMKLICYANWHEVEHIRNELVGGYQAIWDVGFQCKKIMQRGNLLGGFLVDKEPVDEIILFGSCGMLQNKKIYYSCNGDTGWEKVIKLDRLIAPRKWLPSEELQYPIETDRILDVPQCDLGLTVDYSVRKTEKRRLVKQFPDALIVDQESYILGKWCADRHIRFQSVKYVIDKCGRIYPPVWNKIWKRRQHKKMQEKFLERITAN